MTSVFKEYLEWALAQDPLPEPPRRIVYLLKRAEYWQRETQQLQKEKNWLEWEVKQLKRKPFWRKG